MDELVPETIDNIYLRSYRVVINTGFTKQFFKLFNRKQNEMGKN